MALAGKGKKRTTDAKSKGHSKQHKSGSNDKKSSAAAATSSETKLGTASTSAFATNDRPTKDKSVKPGHKSIDVVQAELSEDSDSEGEMHVEEDLEADFLMSLDVKGMAVYVAALLPYDGHIHIVLTLLLVRCIA